jgi:hypothetical protein
LKLPLFFVAAFSMAMMIGPMNAQTPPASADHPFAAVVAVMRHPRCLNCHRADTPRQANNGRIHRPPVVRGSDGKGASAMRCGNCHQESNNSASRVPGAPHWQLAPREMSWATLTDAEICRAVTNPASNGNRTLDELVAHIEHDPLIHWAWRPGGNRTPAPLSHAEFVALAKAWVSSGGTCPQ